MTERPQRFTAEGLPMGLLESQWSAMEVVADAMAEEIEYKSVGLSGNFLERTRFAATFLRGNFVYEQALQQSTLLAFLNPLAKIASANGSDTLSQKEVASAVSSGLCTLSRHGVSHRSLLQLYQFPICLSYFAVIGAILSAHFIVGYFEEMYIEFGISIPWLTEFFLWAGRITRSATFPLLVALFGLPLLLWGINRFGRDRRPPGVGHLDLLLARKRTTIARWLLHVSLLLEAGLEKGTAIATAAEVAKSRWIRKLAKRWERGGEAAPVPGERQCFFERQRFRMAATAIGLPRSAGQVTLLQQVATWYRDRSASMLQWWIQFLVPLLGFFLIATIVLFLFAMLSPLTSIISGVVGF